MQKDPQGSEVSLSVFKWCFALLILSGKLKHKSSKSSFILMSQLLDLLKRENWNGLELATCEDPCLYSCLWCFGGISFSTQARFWSSIPPFHCSYGEALSWVPHPAWRELYANTVSLEKNAAGTKGQWQEAGIHLTDTWYWWHVEQNFSPKLKFKLFHFVPKKLFRPNYT